MYIWLPLASPADLTHLTKYISPAYDPVGVAAKLSGGISGAVKAVLIERNYIDKDYRSTYYNFYAKKGMQYRPDCVRLHFFDETVAFDPKTLRLTSSAGELTYHYFGYMVLRPTGGATIGRSVVSPDVRSGASHFVITTVHEVHLLGYKLTVEGFPSMDQHRDIAVCAHVACWSILRHYSECYNSYREYLTHDITMMAQEFDPGGLVPSKGLGMSHAERVFQEAGTFPFHVARDPDEKADDASFYRQMGAYVESKFPLFAAMHGREHAIAVVGYEWRTPVNLGVPGMRYAWDEVKSIAVVDDHYLPYLSVPVAGGVPYSAEDIDAFIVVLPEKVFYPADAVDRLAPTLLEMNIDGLPAPEETIIRYFMTTGSGFRRFIRGKESEFDPRLIKTIMKLPFAQFIWVIEFATEAQWEKNQISARALVDATAGEREKYPLWLFHSQTEALIFNRRSVNLDLGTGIGTLKLANTSGVGFSRMAQNLRRTQTK